MFSTSFLAARVGAIVCCTVVTVVPFVVPCLAVVEEGMEPTKGRTFKIVPQFFVCLLPFFFF